MALVGKSGVGQFAYLFCSVRFDLWACFLLVDSRGSESSKSIAPFARATIEFGAVASRFRGT